MNFVQIADFDWLPWQPKEFLKKKSKIFFSEAIRGMKLKRCINVHDSSLYINYIFDCRCQCAFMVLKSFHIVIIGKVEIKIYFCVPADILAKSLLKCFWSSPLPTVLILSKSLILIGGHGNRKAKFSREKKNIQKQLCSLSSPLTTIWI